MTTTTNLFKDREGGRTIAAGETIFRSGDAAEHLFVVQSGQVDVRVGDQTVESVGPGGIFGEMAMIDGSNRSADAVAAEESVVLAIDQRRFDFLIGETPFFARTVMTILVERLRASNNAAT